MIASLKSALAEALSLARLLSEAAARVKAAEARADAAEVAADEQRAHVGELGRLLAIEIAARKADARKHERELAEEHEQAQRAIRDRDAAEVQRDAWKLKAEDWRRAAEEATALSQRRLDERDAARGSLASALADLAEARKLAGASPQATPQAIVAAFKAAEAHIRGQLDGARQRVAELCRLRAADEAEIIRLKAECARLRGGAS